MKVDTLSAKAITAEAGERLADVAWRMQVNNVGCVPIVDNGKLVGILTERDVTRAFAQYDHTHDALVSHFMTADPVVIESGSDARDAALKMIGAGVRHLVLVKHGRLKGVVSIRDLMREVCWTDSFPETASA
jgi:CBS domain-containing protein